jgi:ABC-2 type transport system permease protein
VYHKLPFVPASNLIRSSLFRLEDFSYVSLCVVIIWGIIAFILALGALSRRE